jgi:hypothetical protein
MVARVFSKSFLRDVAKHSLEILDNQGVFADTEEKEVRDEFMPWLYTEVFNNLKQHQAIEKFVDKQIDMITHNNKSSHKTVVSNELERRRLEKEDKDRQLFERNERRRLKLEMKLKRRENRRLHNLEKQFMEIYIPTADIDKDLINVSDLDGSDSTGLKSAGFRGGLIGEIYLLLKKLQSLDIYKNITAEWEGYPQLIQTFWEKFVGDAWSVTIGLDGAFDTNAGKRIEGATIDKLDLDFIRSLSPEDYKVIVNQIKAHYMSKYFDDAFPGLVERRAKKIHKVRYVEPTEADEKKPGDDDGGAASPDVSSPVRKKKKKKKAANTESVAPDPNAPPPQPKQKKPDVPPEEVDPDPLYQQLDKFLSKTIEILLDERYGLKGIKFTKYTPKASEEKKPEDAGDEGQAAPAPRILALFVPERPPQEETANITMSKLTLT